MPNSATADMRWCGSDAVLDEGLLLFFFGWWGSDAHDDYETLRLAVIDIPTTLPRILPHKAQN